MISEHDHDLLLSYVYGALDDDERLALERRLETEPALRSALDDARSTASILSDAARIPADDVAFQPKRARLFSLRKLGIAAAVLAAVGAFALTSRSAREREVAAANPVLEVSGPAVIVPGAPAEYLLRTMDASGNAIAADVKAVFRSNNGQIISNETVRTNRDGEHSLDASALEIPPGGEIQAYFLLPDKVAHSTSLADGTRVLTRVGTDKPLYRPGETVRIRGVALEAFRLTPAGDVPLRLEVTDPRGGKVFELDVPSETGVTAWEYGLEDGAAGGAYKVRILGRDDGDTVVAAERTFQVRAYRVPRLKMDVELDRDSYGPGDAGTAWLSVERAEGGIPADAQADAVLTVDGVVASRETLTVGKSGGLSVPFTLPANIDAGRAQLTVTIRDGGTVETVAESVPVLLDRVDVELYPEGGNLVAGLENRMYFRAKTPAGEPADLTADLVDSDGSVVATAAVDVHGMGAFTFVPDARESYAFRASKPVGVSVRAEFPEITKRGVVLRSLEETVDAAADVRLAVASSHGGRHTVSAWCRGVQIGRASVDLNAGNSREVSLATGSDVGGVLRITVTDENGLPVAERLVSREPAQRIDVSIRPDRDKVGPRETVNVQVLARDESGKPTQAIIGATVVDAAVLSLADDEDTAPLPMHFLLGLEVEELERTHLYSGGPAAALAVDRLLGIQGWRRYAWKNVSEFLAEHEEHGARVVSANSGSTGILMSNADSAAGAVAAELKTFDEEFAAGSLLMLLAGLIVGCGVGGSIALWQRRGIAAAVRFGAATFLIVGSFVFLRSEMAEDSAVFREMAAATEAPARALGVDVPEMPEVAKMLLDDMVAPGAADGGIWVGAADNEMGGPQTGGGDQPFSGGGGGPGHRAFRVEGEAELQEKAKDRLGDLARLVEELERADAKRPFAGRMAFDEEDADSIYILATEFAHRAAESTGVRDDFTEVLYWRPLLVTGEDGTASFSFDTSDNITTFEIGVDAHDARGALGTGASTIECRVPFYVEPKFPVELSTGDVLRLPVVIANDMQADGSFDVALDLSGAPLSIRGGAQMNVDVTAGSRGRAFFELAALPGKGDAVLRLVGTAPNGLSDATDRRIPITPRGYPRNVLASGVLERVDGTSFVLPDTLDANTLRGSIRIYPSTLSTLVDGLEDLLQQPGGCFEQASSTNYPNVLVLNYLQEQEAAEPAVARRAKELLDSGYALLTGYEANKQGYEWFGRAPAHESLTAYGLMEFADMAAVYDVDEDMVDRTREWLLDRRDGDGGFHLSTVSLDTFGAAPRDITEAYIVWALTEAGEGAEVRQELDALATSAATSDDAYIVALAANALLNTDDDRAKDMLKRLAGMQDGEGSLTGSTTSVTSSNGINLTLETTALAALAFVKDPSYLAQATTATSYMLSNRRGGRFGSTQSTILCLRALIAHAKASRKTSTDHDIEVVVNGAVVATRHVPAGTAGVVAFEGEILAALGAGPNDIEVRTSGGEALPWALSLKYFTELPATDPDCPIGIETSLARKSAAEGEAVRMTVSVRNLTSEGQPMTIARVGLPAGLEPRAEQLEELRERGEVDFVETRPREVTLYWRGLAPDAVHELHLELIAAIPGSFEGPATAAYLYYGDDKQHWTAPLSIDIDAR